VSVDVLVEPFYEWVIDASQIKGVRPEIQGVTYVEDPLPYIERKLLTVNTGHSAIAYLGYVRGRETIHAALEDPDVRDVASKALEETGLLLAQEYGFDPEELREYRQIVLARFGNPRISDEVTRVARAPIRKLGHDERFVSPACASSRWATRQRTWPRSSRRYSASTTRKTRRRWSCRRPYTPRASARPWLTTLR
jgi:mannitol-1-phosphate 5-dehydrogenase